MDTPRDNGVVHFDTDQPPGACSTCRGTGTRPADCLCRLSTGTGRADPACRFCAGTGSAGRPCDDCAGDGRARAHPVLTVINIDTGAIASQELTPDTVRPAHLPARPGPDGTPARWVVPIAPILDRLAARTGSGRLVFDHAVAESIAREPLGLDPGYRPGLPEPVRRTMVAKALGRDDSRRHRIHIGRSEPVPVETPDQVFGRLCELADRLCVDLVIHRSPDEGPHQRFRQRWRLEFRHSQAPLTRDDLAVREASLSEAVTARPVQRMLADLLRGSPAPARYLDPSIGSGRPARVPSIAEIAERLDGLGRCTGAVGIRREGEWNFSALAGTGEPGSSALRLVDPPAPPRYRGELIDTVPCRATDCTKRCRWCHGTERVTFGYVVTVTDLAGYVRHINVVPDPAAAVTRVPGGHRLGSPYGLADLLTTAEIDPDELVNPVDHPTRPDLLSPVVADDEVTEPTPWELSRTHCARAFVGPVGRHFLIHRPGTGNPLGVLTRIAHAMGHDVWIACGVPATNTTGLRIGWVIELPETGESVPDQDRTPRHLSRRSPAVAARFRLNRLPWPFERRSGTDPLPVINEDGGGDLSGPDRLASGLSRLTGPDGTHWVSARLGRQLVTVERHPADGRGPATVLAEAATIDEVLRLLNDDAAPPVDR